MDLAAVNNSMLTTTNTTLRMAQDVDVSKHFAALMHRAQQSGSASQVEKAARQLIGLALFKPLLAQVHNSPFKTKMFHGGVGEDAFQGQLDQVLADRMAQRSDYPLVKAMIRKFTQKSKVDTHG